MTINKQNQIGGSHNTQIINEGVASLSHLLNNLSECIKQRSFGSEEVRDEYFRNVDEVIEKINAEETEILNLTRYIVVPFKVVAEAESLQDQTFLQCLVDALATLGLTEESHEFLLNFVNSAIGDRRNFGIYYDRNFITLKSAYIALLRQMKKKKVDLPLGFVCIALHISGEYTLDPQKIVNIVEDISGESDYIIPLKKVRFQCTTLTSNMIEDATSLVDAKSTIRGVLGLE